MLSQNKEKFSFSICNNKSITINHANLEKCPRLVVNDKKIKIKSFSLSILVHSKMHPEGFYRDIAINDNIITATTLSFIKELLVNDPYVKVIVENIEITKEGKSDRCKGFIFYVK